MGSIPMRVAISAWLDAFGDGHLDQCARLAGRDPEVHRIDLPDRRRRATGGRHR